MRQIAIDDSKAARNVSFQQSDPISFENLINTYFSFFCSERVVTIDILVARFAPFFPAPHVR